MTKTTMGIAASVLAIMVIVAVTQFELYERTRWVRPSSEAQSDNFYVIGKWLSASDHPVRFRPSWTGMENLSPGDGGLYLQASLFDWEKDGAALLPWIREGGSLLIAVDGDWYQGEASFPAPAPGLEEFLEDLGLILWYPVPDSIDDEEGYEDEYEDDDYRDTDDEEIPDENSDLPEEEGFPVFDRAIALGLEDYGREALVLRDLREDIRLIRLPLGKGSVTVTGEWYFMYTRYLGGYPRNHENARAAWEFTAGSLQAERPGMLFVRGRRASGGFLRSLADRGNLLAPVLSVLALILVGFWMVIPGFGIPLVERRKRPGTIGDRFSAEARFLSRYGAQRIYLETYLRELRRRAGGRDGGRKLNPEVEKVEEALAAGKKLSRREMAVYLKNLMSALERV